MALMLGVIVAVIQFSAPSGTAAQTPKGTFLSFTSQPGDFIGQGQTQTFTPPGSTFDVIATADMSAVQITVGPFPHIWELDFAALAGRQLVRGTYENATRWPFQAPTVPGLSFSGDGRGCNTLTGRFNVLEAIYGPAGAIVRFHATFEQHCEGAVPALFGEVLIIGAPVPTATPTAAPTPTGKPGPTPTAAPTPTPSPTATPTPSASPTPIPSASPSASPAPTPTGKPTPVPPPAALTPMNVSGTVTLNGAPASKARVEAVVGGVVCGTALTTANGSYLLSVASTSQQAGCGTNGATVSFRVNGTLVAQTATFSSGGSAVVGLSSP